MIDHLVLFTVSDDTLKEDLDDLISSVKGLKDSVPGVMDLSVGEDFSGRAGDYTHGLFARFEGRDSLKGYLEHPDHLSVVEKLDAFTDGRIVLDYES